MKGFTLIEVLVAVVIIAILSAIIILLIDPTELIRQGRDSARLNNMSSLERAINYTIQQSLDPISETLCNQVPPPCQGQSDDPATSNRSPNGTGWIKINLDIGLSSAILPTDPINSLTYVYKYKTNTAGTKYEINAVLESKKYQDYAIKDNGSSPAYYEIGTDLTIIP